MFLTDRIKMATRAKVTNSGKLGKGVRLQTKTIKDANQKSNKKAGKAENKDQDRLTSTSKSAHVDDDDNPSQTPHERRHKMTLRIRKLVTADDDCSESSTSSDSEAASSEEESEVKDPVDTASQKSTMPLELRVSDYFQTQSKSNLTSNKTLSSLRQDLLEMDLQQVLSEVPTKHKNEVKRLLDDYKLKFDKWMVYLRNGFNVLLYGLGSKIALLDEFRASLMEEYTVLEVKGYLPELNINLILSSILEILDHDEGFSKVEEEVNFIKKSFQSSKYGQLCLLVHNIDGSAIRNDKAQGALCSLAQCPFIHIVASIDHVRTSLLWDTGKLANFNWIWDDVTTFLPYDEETAYESSFLVKRSGSTALSSVTQVFHSLTPNAKGIFILLAKHQLKKMETNDNYIGMPFQEFYSLCRESFLVNSQLTLNSQLTEFKDHRLLKIKKGNDGGEHLLITLDVNTLSTFLQNHS